MINKFRAGIAAALTIFVVATTAEAATYGFSFSNVDGSVAGTVAGDIVLPDGDGTFAASSIFVTSAPAALNYTLPLDILSVFTTVVSNSFTVSGGFITDASFGAQSASGTSALTLSFSVIGSALNAMGSGDFSIAVVDNDNTTLTLPTAPVPLPAAGWMLLAGAAGLVAATRRRNAPAS